MAEYNYDSYCGMYCGACSILKAGRDGTRDPFADFFADEKKMEVKCLGCKTGTLFENCSVCAMRKCAIDKGVERCLECAEFPCDKMQPEMLAVMVSKLPHLSALRSNLETIRAKGCAAWLAEQAELWTCPECQTPFSWYVDNCTNCGTDLTKRKGFSGPFDPGIFDYIK